jgi:hypothetical protein
MSYNRVGFRIWDWRRLFLGPFAELQRATISLGPALFCVITQRVVVISYRCFGTTFGGPIPALREGSIGCSDSSVRNYHCPLRDNPEERSSQLLHGRSLKSHTLLALSHLSVCPYIRTERLDSYQTDCCEIWCSSIFWKSAEKNQISLKSDTNNGYFTWRPKCIYDNISLNSS